MIAPAREALVLMLPIVSFLLACLTGLIVH